MSEEIIKQALSYSLAADLNEEWRLTRKKEDGTFRPRIKISKDPEWNKTHGTNEVDIANTPFNELPSNWQEENLKAAKVVINLVFKKVINGNEIQDSYDGYVLYKKDNKKIALYKFNNNIGKLVILF